jgi:anti-sigma factor RsiW
MGQRFSSSGRQVKEKVPANELHAYVDNCLSEPKRKAIEARMAEDHELRRQVECWRAQSQAIRVAFGAVAAPATAPRRTLTSEKLKAALAEGAAAHSRKPTAQKIGRDSVAAELLAFARALLPIVLAAGVVLMFPGATPPSPQDALRNAGVSAYRAFASAAVASQDFRAGSAVELVRKLGPGYQAGNLSERLTSPGWTLRGARRVPGVLGEAMLAMVDSAEYGAVGILVEPLDAPPSTRPQLELQAGFSAASFTRGGYGFSAVGRSEAAVAAWLGDDQTAR